MQAAIDRVIRSFSFRHPMSLVEPMPREGTKQAQEEATDFAAHLLANYKGQLSRRSLAND